MTRNVRLLASASVLAVSAIAAPPPSRPGRPPEPRSPTRHLDYKVGGVDQTQVTASDSFTVDRKVNLTVAETGNDDQRVAGPAGRGDRCSASPTRPTLRSTSRSPRAS
jgi:hypothetical protein